MRLAYYPGCSAKGSSADYEMSTQAVCGALGMRLEELPDWNCCGSTPAHAVDTELSAALCVRNLDIAARTQADMVVTPCPSCLSNLRHAAKRMEKPEFRARVNELLQPDQRFAPIAEGASLSAELRMLALMITGITDSTRLARFLGLSLNTVYTYRTRLKGRALDRENFEEKLRKIYEIPNTKLIFESSDTSDNYLLMNGKSKIFFNLHLYLFLKP